MSSASPHKRRKVNGAPLHSPTKQQQPSLLSFFGGASARSPDAAAGSTPLRPHHSPKQNGGSAARQSREELELAKAIAASLRDDPVPIGADPKLKPSHDAASGSPAEPHRRITKEASANQGAIDLTSDDGSTAPAGTVAGSSKQKDRFSDCPICSRRIPFRSIEAHVNSCLDQSTSRAAAFSPSIDTASEVRPAEQAALLRNGAAKDACSPPRSQAPQSVLVKPAPTNVKVSSEPVQSGPPDAAKMFPIAQLADGLEPHARVESSGSNHPTPPPQGTSGAKDGSVTVEPQRATAFTMLMKPHSEAKQWATADAVEAANYRGRARTRPDARTAPFYKVLEGMPLTVDAFRFGRIDGCKGYFLSHFHSDHYGGLTSSWSHGPVYCSVTTANLCRSSLRVDDKWLRPLPMEVPTLIPDSGGVTVTCIDANHCPGSCLFLFEGPQTAQLLSRTHTSPYIGTGRIFRYLHCGDFRASPMHTNHPQVKGKKLDIVYLDTTYCNPRYCFPAQDQVVEACAELVRRCMPVKDESNADSNERKLNGKKEEQEEEEDWRTPPSRGARGQAELVQRSSAAKAFKGWLGVGAAERNVAAVSDEKGDDQGSVSVGIKAEQDEGDKDFGDEEPLLEDEDSLIAAGKLQPGLDGYRDDEPEPEEGSSSRSGQKSPSIAEVAVKKEEDDADDATIASVKREEAQGTPHVKGEAAADGRAESITSRNWLNKQSYTSKAAETLSRCSGRLLVVVGTYTIGKEKVVKAVARTMGTKVFCVDSRKYRVYSQLEDAELHSLLTRDPQRAGVHVTNLHAINAEGLRDMVAALRKRGCDFTHAIAFRPTGWTYKPPSGMETVSHNLDRLVEWNQERNFGPHGLVPTRDSTSEYMIYGVPYSEHSSFVSIACAKLQNHTGPSFRSFEKRARPS
ncbi:DNA cross-link repair protein PSO2/SNM1 [Thecaphora frezii]